MWMLLLLLSHFSRIRPSATPWTAAYQAPPSMGFSRQEYWMGCHCLLQMYSIFPQTGNIGPWIFLSSSIYYSFNNYPPISLQNFISSHTNFTIPIPVSFDGKSPFAQNIPGFSTESSKTQDTLNLGQTGTVCHHRYSISFLNI